MTETTCTTGQRITWHGYLAVETVEEIATRITNLLTGRRYTFVLDWSEHTMPDVRVGLELRQALNSSVEPLDDGTPHAHIGWSDTYGVGGISSTAQTERDAYLMPAEQRTHVLIEGGRYPDDLTRHSRIEIYHYSASGNRLRWIAVPEQTEPAS